MTITHAAWWSVRLLGVQLALVACGGAGCSEAGGGTTSGSGGHGGESTTTTSTMAGVTSTSTGSTSTSSSSTTMGTGGGEPGPCPGWPGWREWDDVAPEMPFCVPESAAALPAPVGWKDCDPGSGLASGCRELDPTWQWQIDPINNPDGYVENGAAVLMLDRDGWGEAAPYRMRTVQEADGPVRWAFLQNGPVSSDWNYYHSANRTSTRQGKTVFRIRQSPNENYDQAVVGGSIDDLAPSVLDYRHITSTGHAVSAGGGLFAMYNAPWVLAAPWDGSPVVDVSTAFSGQQGFPFIFDDLAVWKAGTYPYAKLAAYTPASGSFLFRDYGPGYHYAHGFGTDGIDMVWLHFHDKQSPQAPWETLDIKTAAFTTDAAQIVERRLRSYPSQEPLTAQIAVGCGYAAVRYTLGKVLIVRIADGYWWELPHVGCAAGVNAGWCWDYVVAVTCDEVFIEKSIANVTSVARVQLSSLGALSPPD